MGEWEERSVGAGLPGLAPLLPWQYVVLSYALGLLTWRNLPASFCGLLLLFLAAGSRNTIRLAMMAGAFSLGLGVAVAIAPAPLPRATDWMLEGRGVHVTARVASAEPRHATGTRSLRLVLEEVRFHPPGTGKGEEGAVLDGRLLWTWYAPLFTPAPGSEVRVRLLLRPLRGMANEDLWDYEAWWARQGVRYKTWSRGKQGAPELVVERESLLWRWRRELRQRTLERLRPEASQGRGVLFALLFGERSLLEQETRTLFRHGGVAHSLALSGLHVGMVVCIGFLLARGIGLAAPGMFSRLPRQKIGVLAGSVLVLVYVWLGGWSPSLLRAGLMFLFWGLLLLRERENVLLDGLLAALAVMLVVAPHWVFDLRLQLSVVAVAGIACLLELGRLWNSRRKATEGGETGGRRWWNGMPGRVSRWLAMLLLVSLAAQLAILPFLVWNFGQVALSLWLNALWLPVLGLVTMPLGLAGLLASVLPWSQPGAWLFSLAAAPVDMFIALLRWLEQGCLLPVLHPLRAGWPGWVGYWCVLVLLVLFLRKKLQGKASTLRQTQAAVLALAVLLLSLPGLRAGLQALDTGLSLRMLDVGQGQSLLLELPRGRRLLLDGGGFPFGSFDVGEAIVAPMVTAHRPPVLEWMVLSHADSDHSLGLIAPLRWFRVERFVSNGSLPDQGQAGELATLLRRKGLDKDVAWQAGERVPLGDGVELEVLHPPRGFNGRSDNEQSLALRLLWQGRGMALLPGDLEDQGLEKLLKSRENLRAQVLVLPHHGGWSGLEGRLIERCAPCLALASAGYMNRYGFPDARTLAVAREAGVPVLTTAELGELRVRWDKATARPRLEMFRAGRLEPRGCPER